MSDSIVNIGLSGLSAAQWGIKVTGENLSNATTPGYSVERPVYQESAGQYTTSGYNPEGVTTTTVQRSYSQYLSAELNTAQAQSSSLSTYYTMLGQLNNFVGSPTTGVASAITGFFSGLQTVANNASSTAARQTAISDAQSLASQINAAGQQYDQLRQSVNTQLSSTVTQINGLTSQIATLNQQIGAASTGGQAPNQLLDQLDQAVSSLSQLVGVQTVQSGTSTNVYLANGQPLVVGNDSHQLAAVTSSTDPSELSIAVDGASGSASAKVQTNLPDSAVTGGTLGGLLTFRSQTLDPSESKLGAIATSFAAQVNGQNELGIDLTGNTGGALFNIGTPGVYANAKNTGSATMAAALSNPSQPPTGDYTLSYNGTQYSLTDSSSGAVIGTSTSMPATIGGLAFSMSGTMNAGDSFSVQPTRGALDNFSLTTTNPSAIAAASPMVGSTGTANAGTATLSSTTVSAGFQTPSSPITLAYSAASGTLSGFQVGTTVTVNGTAYPITSATTTVPYANTAGTTFSMASTVQPAPSGTANNLSFTLAGTPANGDTFTLSPNVAGSADGSNANAISSLVNQQGFTGGLTLTNAYANYVNAIGNTTAQVNASNSAQSTVVTQITAAQQSVSGVNQDEEAANLIQYQQLYQANAKVIQTASTMFQTLLGIFG